MLLNNKSLQYIRQGKISSDWDNSNINGKAPKESKGTTQVKPTAFRRCRERGDKENMKISRFID
jgi:hypothetical protein